MPPVALQLRRIAKFLGLEDPPVEKEDAPTKRALEDDLRALAQGGMPILEGKPNDPMLELLDL